MSDVRGKGRKCLISRKTRETEVEVHLDLDEAKVIDIRTGIGFFDHMLTLFATHGHFDCVVKASGDLEVDNHHTVEDVGICLGLALNEALGDRERINRYGVAFVPMDEALAHVVLDLSRRPCLVYETPSLCERIGTMESELVREFLRAFSQHGGITLHARVLYGTNSHHMVEALFKALGRALRSAVSIGDYEGIPSSKGVL